MLPDAFFLKVYFWKLDYGKNYTKEVKKFLQIWFTLLGRNRAETEVQNNGHFYFIEFDPFAQIVKPSNWLKDRGTEVRKAKSIGGIRHSIQIGKKLSSDHP